MTHDNTVSVIFSFLLFLKPFLPNLHSSSSLGFCFSFSHYAFKMITIEKLRSQDFLSGGTSSTFIHFIGTTHYSSFFSHLALNAEGGFSLQATTGYTCVFQPVWIKGTFIVSITAHTGL